MGFNFNAHTLPFWKFRCQGNEQQRHHEGIDQDRYNNVFRSLFNVPTSLLVFWTGIARVDPRKEGRPKGHFPKSVTPIVSVTVRAMKNAITLKSNLFIHAHLYPRFPCFHGLNTARVRG